MKVSNFWFRPGFIFGYKYTVKGSKRKYSIKRIYSTITGILMCETTSGKYFRYSDLVIVTLKHSIIGRIKSQGF